MQIFHYVELKLQNKNNCTDSINEEHTEDRVQPLSQGRHKRSVAYANYFWENASTLKISFTHDVPVGPERPNRTDHSPMGALRQSGLRNRGG